MLRGRARDELEERLSSLEDRITRIETQIRCGHKNVVVERVPFVLGPIGRKRCLDCDLVLEAYYDSDEFLKAKAEWHKEEAAKAKGQLSKK